jgi:hypothetical protein
MISDSNWATDLWTKQPRPWHGGGPLWSQSQEQPIVEGVDARRSETAPDLSPGSHALGYINRIRPLLLLLIGNAGKLRRIEIMTDVIATAITAAIDANCDEDNAARLCRCLPMLLEAIDDWRSGAAVAPLGSVVMAASTPRDAIVFHAADWPDGDPKPFARFAPGDIGAVVSVAVENGSYDIVAAGLSVLLGRAGVAKHRNDALGIIRSGGMAVTALLVDHCSHDRSVAWLSITLAVESAMAVH